MALGTQCPNNRESFYGYWPIVSDPNLANSETIMRTLTEDSLTKILSRFSERAAQNEASSTERGDYA